RAFFPEQPVPPILVGIVDPPSFAVTYIFNDPRPIRMFGFIVYTGQQLLHILFGVLDVLVARVRLPKLIDQEYRPVAAVFIVSRSGRRFPAHARSVTDNRFAVRRNSALGGYQDDTKCCTCAIDGCCRSVLDNGDRLDISWINPV